MYERLMGIIHRHRTWVGLHELTLFRPLISWHDRQPPPSKGKPLVLYARKKRKRYRKGHRWTIQENDLDKAVSYMKSYSKAFHARWRQQTIHPKDAEHIVKLATNGCIDLELCISPDLIKSYYNGN